MNKVDTKTAYADFKHFADEVKKQFVGRDEMVDLIALALLCKQHAFFLSPPGTAKTAVLRTLVDHLDMGFFGIQMRDDTKVEELMGMWDLTALEQGRYQRRWSRAASAEILYVNEAFKGSSNALNAMLGLLHEREVDDETGYRTCPIWTAVLDSNELPRDKKALAAFFDRILFRMPLDYIGATDEFRALLSGSKTDPKFSNRPPFGLQSLHALHECVKAVDYYDGYLDDLVSIRAMLRVEGITVSDRMWAESCGLSNPKAQRRATPVRAMAFYKGRKEVAPVDLLVLEHVFWIDPNDRQKIRKSIMTVTMPAALKAEDLLDSVIDAHAAGMSGGRDAAADAIQISLDAKNSIKRLVSDDGLDKDQAEPYLMKISRLHAEIAERIARV